ncbi:iron ABC transporter permease [Acetobacteraceae bacterium EV16G]|uniref:Iron ABC transporter permease n=1 Tax=Sorlinia euscelidii TaxID=3081148 RepID=A0ABU7U0J7_9PROT
MRRFLLFSLSGLGACALALVSISLGPVHFGPHALYAALRAGPFSQDVAAQIIWTLRFPRLILAIAAGIVMARAGMALQVVTRNGLADPYLFGLSSGASAGAMAMIVFFGDQFGAMTAFTGAICGGGLATIFLMTLLFSQLNHRSFAAPGRLILGGVAISFLFTTCADLLVYAGDRNTAQSILFWTMGSFSAADWQTLPFALTAIMILTLFLKIKALPLEALKAGDDVARSLGVCTSRLRVQTILLCALSCGAVVAITGPIPFIGLIVPHLVRGLGRMTITEMTPIVGVLGAGLAVGSDVMGRIVLPDQEIPVGVVISAMGSLFLGWMVARGRI